MQLQDGDLIFLSIPNPLYRRVAAATGSRASHVGIAFYDEQQGWLVAESTFPVAKYTPLARYLARTDNGWVTVRRCLNPLTPQDIQALRRECDKQMGRFYHLGFRYESKRLFCSKLVYDAFANALAIEIGKLETFAELLHKQPNTQLWFWRLWFFGRIPWQRVTVSPASQMLCEKLTTVYESESTG